MDVENYLGSNTDSDLYSVFLTLSVNEEVEDLESAVLVVVEGLRRISVKGRTVVPS